jgi:hypothetical protein
MIEDHSIILVYDNSNGVLDFVYPVLWLPSDSRIEVLQSIFADSFDWCDRTEDAWALAIPDEEDRCLLALKKLLRNVKSSRNSQSLFVITVTGE